jgi:hypothetical protein
MGGRFSAYIMVGVFGLYGTDRASIGSWPGLAKLLAFIAFTVSRGVQRDDGLLHTPAVFTLVGRKMYCLAIIAS